jgi:hypothetical protein
MQWTISQIDQQFSNGKLVPAIAHWQCAHTDGDGYAQVYGTARVDKLTAQITSTQSVLEHIWANGLDKAATEKACLDQIARQRIAAGALRLSGAVSAPAPTTPLDKAKAAAWAQVDDYHTTVVTSLVGNPTQTEKDTWTVKLETAAALSAGDPPGIAGRAFLHAAGISKPDDQQAWAKLVLGKAAAYAGVIGVGEKLRGQARQAIQAAKSADEINAILEASIQQTEATVKAFLKA